MTLATAVPAIDYRDPTTYLIPTAIAVIGYFAVLWIALAYWVVRDSRLRTESAGFTVFSAFLVLGLPYLGTLIYLVVRPPHTLDEERALELEAAALVEPPVIATERPCPTCGREIEKDFVMCPYCRTQFARRCRSCGRWLRLGWRLCPYCAEDVGLQSLGGGRAASS
ncbi:MAG TPA: zinc ribbon domain-containing protein [Candidatus Dormibacteraeota bacterium]|nr:zinc ribbon domain-containing protein [Candidatus Dormibacteraeota bacterium]